MCSAIATSIKDTLKWLWDPRSDQAKKYQEWENKTPLKRRTQKLTVFIKDKEPVGTVFSRKDIDNELIKLRLASDKDVFEDQLHEWLSQRGTKGILIGSAWFGPEVIEWIQLGEQTAEDL
jgi:hypothetical protein